MCPSWPVIKNTVRLIFLHPLKFLRVHWHADIWSVPDDDDALMLTSSIITSSVSVTEQANTKLNRQCNVYLNLNVKRSNYCGLPTFQRNKAVRPCSKPWFPSRLQCSAVMLKNVPGISRWRWFLIKTLTCCVIQVQLNLFSSQHDSGSIFFKHWWCIFLFLTHKRNFCLSVNLKSY